MTKRFKIINPKLSYTYGLPKTTKKGVPLRPIIANTGSYIHKLSQYLSSLLSPAVGKLSNSNVVNILDFIEKAKKFNINGKLLSLDVNSLFTKVPVDETLNFLRRKLPSLNLNLPFSCDILIDLVNICVTNNVFECNGRYYKQKYGMAMGSSLSPILSNLFMKYFESELVPNILNIKWLRYVDNIFFDLARW